MKRIVLLVVLVALCFSAKANASGDYSVGNGNWMVGANADLSRMWGGAISGTTTFATDIEVGRFCFFDWLMPQLKFGAFVSSDFDAEELLAGTRLYWNKKTALLPFAQINLGFASVKAGDRYNAFAVNPGIGLDYLVAKNVAVGIQFNYTAFVRDGTINQIDIPVGLHIYF